MKLAAPSGCVRPDADVISSPPNQELLLTGTLLMAACYGAGALSSLLARWSGRLALGVLYALQQHDLKRLLAFHSVENIGIILIGVGLAMILWRREEAGGGALATVALTAALLHTVNHAAFKGLLFLGAGSVFCGRCAEDPWAGAVAMGRDFEFAARTRSDLRIEVTADESAV